MEKMFSLWIALTIANFIFEGVTEKKWVRAIDRSIFQAIALLVYVLVPS